MSDQSATYIPLHRVATAQPFMDYLHQQGAPVERELQRAYLPVQAMNDPDCFIPSHHYWNFIANVANREGIKDLGFLVGLHSGANAADPGLAKQLARLPSLHQALDRLCKIASTEISQVALWLEPAGSNSQRLHYRTSFGPEHPAYVHFQWYGLMAVIAAIRLFAGRHWHPRQIGLGTTTQPGETIRQYFPHARFHTRQTHCFIGISNRLLGKPPQVDEDLFEASPRYKKIRPPRDFIGTLKLALRSYLMDGAPSVELAADIAGLSTRTLQRRLADEGWSYRELLNEVRFEAAVDLMQDTDYAISDIASLLGYSDPSHFARAFRRMAGVSPREYMQQG
ncbi:MAG: AraC family transcriptional regulator [Gammaproteobacteria bacterium]|nr:AraC family transcriptional regulator [Gammaproteobacteria bacterium]MDH3987343.1 AraC family transcriptional regulator [Gammaproteobacteria bacterium]